MHAQLHLIAHVYMPRFTHTHTHTHTHKTQNTKHTHTRLAVRGTALAAIAAAAAACGPKLVPTLPQASAAVLGAVESACTRLSTPAALAAGAAAASRGDGVDGGAAAVASAPQAQAAVTPKKQQQQKEVEEEDEGGEGAEAAVEMVAALAALGGLVQHLGPFLSPYLPRMLRALLHPATLARADGGTASPSIAAAASAVRRSLPACVPARLLLQPLFGALPHAMGAGGMGPIAALMRMVAATAAGMEAGVAAAHHEAIFGFLLRALDVRHTAPAALKGGSALPLHCCRAPCMFTAPCVRPACLPSLPLACLLRHGGASRAQPSEGSMPASAHVLGPRWCTHLFDIWSMLVLVCVRRPTPTRAAAGFEAEAEQAAISALVALVLKLSEARFKPLFLRLLEWAMLPAASATGARTRLHAPLPTCP